MSRQCSRIKPNGERCKGAATGQHGLCWAHDPQNAEQRRRTASAGGRSKPNQEVRLIKEEIKAAISEIQGGELDRNTARAMFNGWSVLLDYIKLERGIYIEEDLARRVEELRHERRDAS